MGSVKHGNMALNIGGAALAAMLAGALWFTLWALIYREVPDKNLNALLIVIGALTTNIATVVGWYFGGSLSGKQQSETINTLANTNASAQAALAPAQPDITVPAGDSVTVKAADPQPQE